MLRPGLFEWPHRPGAKCRQSHRHCWIVRPAKHIFSSLAIPALLKQSKGWTYNHECCAYRAEQLFRLRLGLPSPAVGKSLTKSPLTPALCRLIGPHKAAWAAFSLRHLPKQHSPKLYPRPSRQPPPQIGERDHQGALSSCRVQQHSHDSRSLVFCSECTTSMA